MTEFEETPVMSSYLLALTISDFVCRNVTARVGESDKTNVRVCGRPNAPYSFDFVLKASSSLMEFYQRHFGITFPLSKCGKTF